MSIHPSGKAEVSGEEDSEKRVYLPLSVSTDNDKLALNRETDCGHSASELLRITYNDAPYRRNSP